MNVTSHACYILFNIKNKSPSKLKGKPTGSTRVRDSSKNLELHDIQARPNLVSSSASQDLNNDKTKN